jgi:universal stress protein A
LAKTADSGYVPATERIYMAVERNSVSEGVATQSSPNEKHVPSAHAEPEFKGLPWFNIQQIVVPIDFSDCSKKALRYAASLAQRCGARLRVVYAVQGQYWSPDQVPVDMAAVESQVRTDVEAKLHEWAVNETVNSPAIAVTVRFGVAATEVISVAKEVGADLIVVSTDGYTGVKRAWFGSVSEEIVRQAPCPVLVVREHERDFVV